MSGSNETAPYETSASASASSQNGTGRTVAGRAVLLRRSPAVIEEVPVPELGDGAVVLLRKLNAGEKNRFDARGTNLDAPAGSTARTNHDHWTNHDLYLLVETIVDESGRQVLSIGDVEELKQADPVVVARLYQRARRLCGYAAEDVAVLAKNSSATPAGSSSTG